MSKLSPQAVRNVQRILDDIARRRLEERDRDAVGLFDGTDEGFAFAAPDSGHSDYSDCSHCFNCPVFSQEGAITVDTVSAACGGYSR